MLPIIQFSEAPNLDLKLLTNFLGSSPKDIKLRFTQISLAQLCFGKKNTLLMLLL